MSRIGKKPVQVPAGVTASVDGQKVTAKGPKGELFFVANDEVSVKSIPQVANRLGITILSTPKGVMADHQAREQNVGGEVLCSVF